MSQSKNLIRYYSESLLVENKIIVNESLEK